MRVRLLVLACFVMGLLLPVLLAYHVGLVPETDADATLERPVSVGLRVARLGWSSRPLGLAGSGSLVVWQQTGRSPGLWAYDAARQETRRLADGRQAGIPVTGPAMSGPTVVWTARAQGRPQIRILDTDVLRVSHTSGRATHPVAGGHTVAWVWPRGAGDLIGVLDTVTGVRASVGAGGRVRLLAAWGPWVAWGVGGQGAVRVFAVRSASPQSRYLLAPAATALAMDGHRVLWAAPRRHGKAALVSWDRRSGHAEQLAVVPGPVTSLTMQGSHAAWTRPLAAGADVWACDLRTGRTYAISQAAGDQLFPVLTGHTLFWADGGGGRWVLRDRRLPE